MKSLVIFIAMVALCISVNAQPNPVSATIPGDTSVLPFSLAFQSVELFTNFTAPNTNVFSATNAVGQGPYHTDVFIVTSNLVSGTLLDQYSLDGSNWCTISSFTVPTVAITATPVMFSNIFVGKWDYWRLNYQGTNLQGTFETEIGR